MRGGTAGAAGAATGAAAVGGAVGLASTALGGVVERAVGAGPGEAAVDRAGLRAEAFCADAFGAGPVRAGGFGVDALFTFAVRLVAAGRAAPVAGGAVDCIAAGVRESAAAPCAPTPLAATSSAPATAHPNLLPDMTPPSDRDEGQWQAVFRSPSAPVSRPCRTASRRVGA